MIPSKFQLKGKTWAVRRRKMLANDECCLGLCDFERRIIYLRKDLSPKEMVDTFLHELGHAFLHEAHIHNGVKFSAGLEEVICDAFADAVQTTMNFSFKRKQKSK